MTDTSNPGLVICDITVREPSPYKARFVSPQQVADASKALARRDTPAPNAMSYAVELTPGSVRVTRTNPPGQPRPDNYKQRQPITAWSAKSRSAMIARLCSLDYEPMLADPSRIPALITLTYPGKWLDVAPNGNAAKKHLRAFRLRYERRFGEPLRAVWKMEFQRRGAPHFHLFCVPPTDTDFRTWLSQTWADIVAHPDPSERARHVQAGTGLDFETGLRSYDAKRVAVYFSKHASANKGAKEYQNRPPQPWTDDGSIGRFWGYWGLEPCTARATLTDAEALTVSRILRRWARANAITTRRRVPRVRAQTGEVTWRHVTRRQAPRLRNRLGFVSVNDGASFGYDLCRVLGRPGGVPVALDTLTTWESA